MLLPILAVLTGLFVVVVWIGLRSWEQQPRAGGKAFALMAGGVAWWIGAMVLAHVADQFLGLHAVFVFLTRVEWAGIFLMTASLVLFVLAYSGRPEFATRRVAGMLLALPVALYPVAFANGVILDAVGAVVGVSLNLSAAFDPWLAVEPLVLGYIYVLLAASSILLLAFLLTSRLPHPEVAVLWLLALVIPWTINGLYVTGAIPPLGPAMIDPTPFGFVGLAAVGFLAMRRSESVTMAPLARAYVVDHLTVGILVVDRAGAIVDANEHARILLDEPSDLVGRELERVLQSVVQDGATERPVAESADADAVFDQVSDTVLTIQTRDGPREIAVETTPLRPASEGEVRSADSYGVVLRDVTDRIDREATLERQTEQLEVVNQVVRHDIRNDMQVVGGHADLLDDFVAPEGREYLSTIRETAAYVVGLTRTVGNLTDAILADEVDLEPIALDVVLEREIAEVGASHGSATITAGELPAVAVRANEMLASVFRNLLQNAIVHNPHEAPTVAVSVTEGADTVVVRVADDGPGIPPDRRETLFERGERGDASEGSGLGLYLVETLVDQYGGNVWVESAAADDAGPTDGTSDASLGGATFAVELQTVEPAVD